MAFIVRRDGSFFDNFQGSSIDPSKWTVYNRIADLVNSEVNGMIPSAVAVNNGLTITSAHVPGGFFIGDSITAPQEVFYSSGQIASSFQFKYGTASIRCKVPAAAGTWPLFWMLGYLWQSSQPFTANIPGNNWPHDGWCEIDIMEFLGGSRDTNNCAVWFWNGGSNGSAAGGALPFDATTRFMIYRLEWSANLLRWSVDAEDGVGFRTLRTITDPAQIPNVPMYLILSTAIGGAGGAPVSGEYPSDYVVSWVRVTP